MLGNSLPLCVLLSALWANTDVAQRLPGKAATMLIRPHDHQPALIPHHKAVLFLPLLRCRLFCHCHLLPLSVCLGPFFVAQTRKRKPPHAIPSQSALRYGQKEQKQGEIEGSERSRVLAHLLAYHSCPEESKRKIMRTSLNLLLLSSSRRQGSRAVPWGINVVFVGEK